MANSGIVIHDSNPELEWLTVPDLVDVLRLSQSQVRRLIEDDRLVAVRREGILVVPASFVSDAQPLPELYGTITVLRDLRFTDDDIVDWMTSLDETLGVTPIDALRAGRKAEVRRVAMTLV